MSDISAQASSNFKLIHFTGRFTFIEGLLFGFFANVKDVILYQ